MKDKYYPIMDKPYTELITEALIDETVPVIKTVAKTLYNRTVGDAINNYREYRFTQKQNRFIQEEELLSREQVKNFYRDIDNKKLDLLYDLLDKARITAYDLHAKILSKLYGNFMRNGELDYYEETLLINLEKFNEEDINYLSYILYLSDDLKFRRDEDKKVIYEVDNNLRLEKKKNFDEKLYLLHEFSYPKYEDYYDFILDKFISLRVITKSKENKVNLTEFGYKVYSILKSINIGQL